MAIALAALALVLNGCGGNSSSDAEEAPATKQADTDLPNFHQAEYDVMTTWKQEVSDKHVGDHLESVWRDPAVPEFKMAIDSRASAGAPSSPAAAKLARLQVSSSPTYRELSFKKTKAGHLSAIRWTYDLNGTHHFAYFFAECGVNIVLRGKGAIGAGAFAYFYDQVVKQIKPVCNE